MRRPGLHDDGARGGTRRPHPLSGAWSDIVQAVLAAPCPGCGRRGAPLCKECLRNARTAPIAPPPPGLDWWVVRFEYSGAVRELVARAKYRDERSSLRWLAVALAECLPDAARDCQLLTWVPASGVRRREHGVDHGAVLARHVARHLGIPPVRLLARAAGAPQTGSPAQVRRIGPRLCAIRSVRGMCVMVVDDVTTSGASLSAAARALRDAGAASVGGVVGARTPRS